MGIPPGYGFKQLLFGPVANALVVQTESAGSGWRPERLYFRYTAWDKYRPIGEPGDLYSQESPFVHPSRPLVAYNCLKHYFFADGSGVEINAANWDSVKIFDLERGKEVESIDQQSVHLPAGIVSAWVADLVAFSEAGLFVKAGFSEHPSSMDYFVAALDVAERTLKPIVPLPASFM